MDTHVINLVTQANNPGLVTPQFALIGVLIVTLVGFGLIIARKGYWY